MLRFLFPGHFVLELIVQCHGTMLPRSGLSLGIPLLYTSFRRLCSHLVSSTLVTFDLTNTFSPTC